MYPLTCAAGYNAPARRGKYEIVGFTALVADSTAASQMAIIDDPAINQDGIAGLIYPTSDLEEPTTKKHIIVNIKGHGSSYDTVLEWFPAEPVKLRYGISLAFENIEQGSMCVYVR